MCRVFKDSVSDPPTDDDKEALLDDLEFVQQMLPPGIDILGTFVVCDTDDVEKSSERAWELVKLSFLGIKKLGDRQRPQHILTYNATGTGKATCKLVVGDKSNLDKNELQTIKFEFVEPTSTADWIQVDTQYDLSKSHFFRSCDLKDSAYVTSTRIRETLTGPVQKAIEAATIMFDGELRDKKQSLEQFVPSKEQKLDRSRLAVVTAEVYEQNVGL